MQHLSQPVHTVSGEGTGKERPVSQVQVGPKGFLARRNVLGQVCLVDADDGREAAPLGSDQVPIQKLRPQRRIAPGGHDQHLVGVGDDDLLQVTVKHIGASQDASARQDRLHDASASAVLRRDHLVTNGDHVSVAGVLCTERATDAAYEFLVVHLHTAQAAADLGDGALYPR